MRPAPPVQHRLDAQVRGELVAILAAFGVSLAVVSYRSGVMLLASADEGRLALLPRAFDAPMGLAAHGGRMALATRSELVHFAASRALAAGMPGSAGAYSQLWLPRGVNFTGEIDLHDPAYAGDAVVGLATRFSCLVRCDTQASFTPLWRPPFISDLASDDRCHLNGLAVDEAGTPRFVTMLGATDTPEGWRAGRERGGVLMAVPDGRVVLDGLCMPHSPRLAGDELLLLNSGAGEVLRLRGAGGTPEVVARLQGYARGLVVRGDLAFVGLSRLRDRRGAGRAALPVEASGEALRCGVAVLDRHTGRVLAELLLSGGVDEVSDIALLDGAGRQAVLSHADTLHRDALALPDRGFWATRDELAA